MRFGVYIPTFAGRDLGFDQAARVKEFARKAEALGFDALWVAEHFLEAPGLYGTVWMSPLLCLAHAASVTTRIRLATGLLILPYYHPVTLAREIQTLWHLSSGRFVLGVGPGWDQHEFQTLGMKLSERGRRTDEMMAALRRLLTERDVSFAGRYYPFEHVTIEPLLPARNHPPSPRDSGDDRADHHIDLRNALLPLGDRARRGDHLREAPRPRQALPAHGQRSAGAGAPHHRHRDVPRDGHALLAPAGGGGAETM